MHIYEWAPAALTIAAALIAAPAAHGSTVNTYTFTQIGWFDLVSGQTIGNPEPEVSVFGSFTAALEPDGTIGLGDLTAFTATINTGAGLLSESLSQLTLFSFNTNGGASSLGFAALPVYETNICEGSAVYLTASCTSNFNTKYPPGLFGVYEGLGVPFLVSKDLPEITLVSSVTTPPVGTTPEPASLLLSGAVLVFLGIFRRRNPTS